MKQLFILTMFFGAMSSAYAEPTDFETFDFQALSENMAQAQACVDKIDPKQTNALIDNARATQDDIQNLCDGGKTVKAQNKALSWVKGLKDDVTMKPVLDCAGNLGKMLPILKMVSEEDASKQENICDLID